jgi:hypothetical protein
MIRALISGQEDPAVLANLARKRLRAKIPLLREALKGGVREHHRFMLQQLMSQVDMLEAQIAAFVSRMASMMSADEEKIERLKGIPGVDDCAARLILAEIGTDMSQFPRSD